LILLDKPYVSDFLKKTIKDHDIPVVDTEDLSQVDLCPGIRVISGISALQDVRHMEHPILYTNSENAIGWIVRNLEFTNLPEKIDLFKNKVKFRDLTHSLFPDFYYKGITIHELTRIDFDELTLPFIIKPAVGFFSMGVYRVSNHTEWLNVIESIHTEMEQVRDLYPEEVLDTDKFIIEQCIYGEEYAVDAYINHQGEPVILSILKHLFSSDTDVSDRVYVTSKSIIEDNLNEFAEFAAQIAKRACITCFPLHMELRRDAEGTLLPIEVNPMRFGGWCSTADLSCLAFGFNPYLCYFKQQEPDWTNILKDKDGKHYGLIVLDNSTGVETREILSFDYDRLLTEFHNPLELRKIDFREYPVFGFLFTETPQEHFGELEMILKSDLKKYITLKK